ncbi:MAG: hypothetical protein LT071_03055 [Nocardioides sp.]|nr:hypothetical protein [Nocardioides sp.]
MTVALRSVALALVLLATGCSGGSGHRPVETPQDFVEVVGDRVHEKPSEVDEWDVMTRELGVDAPGAFLQFDAYSLAVAVMPSTDSPFVCADESFFDECVDLEHNGTDLVLAWQELEPEVDPGVVYVIDRRDDEDVLARYTGASIQGDPRRLDLGITVGQMADIVTDERLTLG